MRRDAGVTILEVLIALAIVGVIAGGFVTFQSNMLRSMKHYRVEGEKEDVKNWVRRPLVSPSACRLTINRAVKASTPALQRCRNTPTSQPNRFIQLLDGSGTPFVASPNGASPTKVGDFLLRAYCTSQTNYFAIQVQALRVDASGNPAPHPTTGAAAEWEDLFRDFPIACDLNEVKITGFMSPADVVNRVMFGSSYTPSHFPNQLMDRDDDGGGGRSMPFNSSAERKMICSYLGMSTATFALGSSFSSCSNDFIFRWSTPPGAAGPRWVREPCSPAANSWIGQLGCAP